MRRVRMNMNRHLAVGLLILVLSAVTPTAGAVHPLQILEDTLEMDALQGRWPDDSRGQMVMVSCVGCAHDRYRLGADAEFLLDEEPVPYRTLLTAIRSGRYHRVFVAIGRSSGEITRVRVLP